MSFVYLASNQRVPRAYAFALGLALPLSSVTVAFAQNANPSGGSPQSSGAPASGGSGGQGATGGTTVTTVPGPTVYQTYPGGVAPTPPGQILGGGNVQFSSSKPITGNETDSFDFKRGGSGGSVRGGENSSFIIGSGTTVVEGGTNANMHLVRKGDTLWAICDSYFHNPYQWPRIWSYNPQIQNPHWIYPGDQVRLRSGTFEAIPTAATGQPGGGTVIDRRKQVPADTIFLRNEGYVEEDQSNWGEVNGAREDKLFLSDYDEVYLRIGADHDVKIGQELTVYRPIKKVRGGQLIAIQGTVRVDQWNPKERIARARITESLDVIERGARIGPVTRRFEVVPPARNDKDVEASILTSVIPHNFYGQNQVVFIDKGEEAGLRPGNRLQVIRKGDAWHQTQPSRASARRIALEDESPASTESVPKPREDSALPEEVLAELRVISVRKNTAMALVTTSRREVEAGDHAFARKGY